MRAEMVQHMTLRRLRILAFYIQENLMIHQCVMTYGARDKGGQMLPNIAILEKDS